MEILVFHRPGAVHLIEKKNNLPKNCMKCAAELAELAELAEQSALAAAVCGFDPAIEDSALNIRYFMYTVVQIIILE